MLQRWHIEVKIKGSPFCSWHFQMHFLERYKIHEFWLKIDWSLFLRVHLRIFQHRFRWCLPSTSRQAFIWTKWWLVHRRMYASLDLNEWMQWLLMAWRHNRSGILLPKFGINIRVSEPDGSVQWDTNKITVVVLPASSNSFTSEHICIWMKTLRSFLQHNRWICRRLMQS